MWGRFRLLSNFGRSLSSAAFTSVVSDTTTAAAKSNSEIPVLYSFLQPSIFALRKDPNPSPPPHPSPRKAPRSPDSSSLETALESSLLSNDAEEAWRTFKTLTSHSAHSLPAAHCLLITHLCSPRGPSQPQACLRCCAISAGEEPRIPPSKLWRPYSLLSTPPTVLPRLSPWLRPC
ncbi:hypothetical protein HPP92_007828 [Vanilla planifolia]|uniref:At1g68980-like TPR repeats domain-containing protein n=1 Tax=Vanilla planifolia TaxID=51239 RepID=A0A835RN73_VANPL|nr:hypothetical protein HPP92_007828 [Vanilla planifolia]